MAQGLSDQILVGEGRDSKGSAFLEMEGTLKAIKRTSRRSLSARRREAKDLKKEWTWATGHG